MMTLKDLREQRGRLVTEMRGMLDAAGADKRDLTLEEQTKYDLLFTEQENVGQQIAREERQLELDRRMAEIAAGNERDEVRMGSKDSARKIAPIHAPRRNIMRPSRVFLVGEPTRSPAKSCVLSRRDRIPAAGTSSLPNSSS